MKSGELQLPYYKQGDDLSHILGDDLDRDKLAGADLVTCLEQHAAMLEGGADQLREVAKVIKQHNGVLSVQADTHQITLAGPDKLIDQLLKAELLAPDPFEDEEEEY